MEPIRRERTISGMRGDAAEVVIDSYVRERERGNAATKTFSQLTFRGRQKQHRRKEGRISQNGFSLGCVIPFEITKPRILLRDSKSGESRTEHEREGRTDVVGGCGSFFLFGSITHSKCLSDSHSTPHQCGVVQQDLRAKISRISFFILLLKEPRNKASFRSCANEFQ